MNKIISFGIKLGSKKVWVSKNLMKFSYGKLSEMERLQIFGMTLGSTRKLT